MRWDLEVGGFRCTRLVIMFVGGLGNGIGADTWR